MDGGIGAVLPVGLTSFVGRSREVAELIDAIEADRLVSVVGEGGAGKTRLAALVADGLVPRFGPRLHPVDLSRARSGEEVVVAVAERLAAGPATTPAIRKALLGSPALLLLDNCEQVVDDVATLVDELLRTCPELTVLATSREPLGVPGERLLRLGALMLPDPAATTPAAIRTSPAVQLFLERAGWTTNDRFDGVAVEVGRICRRLEGLPLAIELAAAHAELLPAAHIAEALDQRFELLTGGPRTAPARHRTLEASLWWSWDLLDGGEADLLATVAVFASPFGREAVAAVWRPEPGHRSVLDTLRALVAKSLVVALGDGRFRLVETVHQFAAARLAERDADGARRRHADWVLALLRGPASIGTLSTDPDVGDEVEAALRWAEATGDHTRLVELASVGWNALGASGTVRGVGWCRRALAVDPPPEARAWLLVGIGFHIWSGGAPPPTAEVEEVLELAAELGSSVLAVIGLSARSALSYVLRGPRAGLADLDVAIAMAEGSGAAVGQVWRCVLLRHAGHVGEADALGPAALAHPIDGTPSSDTSSRGMYGWGLVRSGRPREALAVADAVIAACRGAETILAHEVRCLAFLALGDLAAAHTAAHEAGRRSAGSLLPAVIECRVAEGRAEETLDWILDDHQWVRDSDLRFDVLGTWPTGASVLAHHGLADRAEEVLDWLAGSVRVTDEPWMRLQHGLARAAVRRRRGAPTLDALGEAFEVAEANGFHGPLGNLVLELAAALQLAGRPGDASSALGLLDALGGAEVTAPTWPRSWYPALHTLPVGVAPQGGVAEVLRAARRLCAAAGPDVRPAFGWDALTPAELAVARLVAEGRTNPEIADALFVARSTVATHLKHVYAKLGVHTRTALARELLGRAT